MQRCAQFDILADAIHMIWRPELLMPMFYNADDATRNSYLAVILCVIGSVVGIGLAFVAASVAPTGFFPISMMFVSIFALLLGNWAIRYKKSSYDPSTTFVTYIITLMASAWAVRFFFIEPALGPYSAEFWTVPTALTNAAFGIILFLLIGMTLGSTYYAARRTYGKFSGRRLVYAFVGVGLPIYFLAQTEYFLATFLI